MRATSPSAAPEMMTFWTSLAPPDILRFGMAPPHLRHAEMWDAATILAEIMRTEGWRAERFRRRAAVT